MATGANDANGVYNFGNDDVWGPHPAALLNELATSVSTVLGALLAKAILQRTTTLALANGAPTDIPYDSTDLVNTLGSAFTYTRSTGLLVCGVAGTWEFDTDVTFAANATGNRAVALTKAVAATPTTFVEQAFVTNPALTGSIAAMVNAKFRIALAVGDVVKIQADQSSGASLNLTGAHVQIKKVA